MTCPSCVIDAEEAGEVRFITCPSCGHNIELQNRAGIQDLPGLPAGVKFDPSDQEILEHLEAKVSSNAHKIHPLIDEFIPTIAALEACERWKLRGNEAYKQGNLSRAEECYTKGVKSVPCNDISGSLCLEPLVLCYSNRAAVRMTCKRFRDALGDCLVAATLDPNFLKVRLRAANCHLLLGEVEDAVHYFSKLSESGANVCLDRKVVLEAADGLDKAMVSLL